MKLYAVSDLHVGNQANRDLLAAVAPHPEDWLILGGDVGETLEHLEWTLRLLQPRFQQLLWVPGNHELWTVPRQGAERGEGKYQALLSTCRRYGALTPEDPYPLWEGEGPRCVLVPLFLLYDYSFRPTHVTQDNALAWAMEAGILCADELYLHPDPFPDMAAWCAARLRLAAARLGALPQDLPTVLINHFPLRYDLVRLPHIPRFSLWCGTRHTEDWHVRYRARVVVSGHLHVPATDWRDGVRFEEVSLGYPQQWQLSVGPQQVLREILPGSAPTRAGQG